MNTIGVSNGLDPDQDRHSVGADLGPNVCKGYQQLTKVAVSKERVYLLYFLFNCIGLVFQFFGCLQPYDIVFPF